MADQHGKSTKVLIDQFDVSSYLNQATAASERELAEVTAFGDDDKAYLAGIGSGRVTLGGFWDPAANASDSIFNTALSGDQLVVSASPQGASAVGQRAVLVHARQTDYGISVSTSEAVQLTSDGMGDGAFRRGVVLHELTAETGNGDYASVDGSASTSNGAVAHLHVTAFSGTNATIIVEDSADDAVFSSLISFSSVTGVTSERGTATGTVERYVRAAITGGTFTSVTFVVTFARLLQ